MGHWGVGSGRYTGDEFVSELNNATFSSSISLTGLAKPSATNSDQQILFTQTTQDDSWICVPAKLLEFVDVLGEAAVGDKQYLVVRLSLQKPTEADEISIVSDLLEQRATVIGDGTLPFGIALRGDGTLPFGIASRGDGTMPFGIAFRQDASGGSWQQLFLT